MLNHIGFNSPHLRVKVIIRTRQKCSIKAIFVAFAVALRKPGCHLKTTNLIFTPSIFDALQFIVCRFGLNRGKNAVNPFGLTSILTKSKGKSAAINRGSDYFRYPKHPRSVIGRGFCLSFACSRGLMCFAPLARSHLLPVGSGNGGRFVNRPYKRREQSYRSANRPVYGKVARAKRVTEGQITSKSTGGHGDPPLQRGAESSPPTLALFFVRRERS